MSKRWNQLEKPIRQLLGFIIFPLIITLFLLYKGITSYNMSGLMQEPFAKIISIMVLLWWLRSLYVVSYRCLFIERRKFLIHLCIYAVLTILAVCIPYIEGSLFASLHLVFSYGAFGIFNLLLFDTILNDIQCRNIYGALLLFVALLCFTRTEISGIAELIYIDFMFVFVSFINQYSKG